MTTDHFKWLIIPIKAFLLGIAGSGAYNLALKDYGGGFGQMALFVVTVLVIAAVLPGFVEQLKAALTVSPEPVKPLSEENKTNGSER
jgi:hypothetical protein